MNIAYIRVSSVDQNEQRQLEGLKKYDINEWFIEKVSAKDTNRPKLQEMLKFARKGDTIYVLDFSRLARSTMDLLKLIDEFRKKEIHIVSIKENFDTSTATGKLMLTMMAAINEFERTNLLERQKEGIAIAKKEGKYKGRKKINFPSNWTEVYNLWKDRTITGTEAMKRMDLKRNTFYNLVKEYEDQ